jgi:RHS repeat-associated protein
MMIYDPWGQQLDQNGNSLCGTGTPTTRGHTGEEQFPVGCLVNLNARLYDPILGRFMAGDPVVSSVYDPLALNRYAYAHDNPLSLTDTDGQCGIFCFFLVDIFSAVITAEVLEPVFAKAPILGDLLVIADGIFRGPLCAAEQAGAIAGVKSGSVAKGLEAFVLTYAEAEAFKGAGGLTAKASIAHGLVGGTFSAIEGQGFGSGFLAAGLGQLATPYVDQ